jgi:hypothetical protein
LDESQPGGSKYNIQFGDVTESQFVVGDYNTVSQRRGLSPAQTAELRAIFADLKSSVAEGAPEELRGEALAKAGELEHALVNEQPDPGTVRRVLRWFKEHAPQLAGAVVSVVVNPLIGKLVEGAGSAIADELRQAVEAET